MKIEIRKFTMILAVTFNVFASHVLSANAANTVFTKGETLTYNISKFKVKVAEASLTYQGPVIVDGQELLLVDFIAKGVKFLDEEKIYLDPKTFYPVMIKRNLNVFGSKEQIDEYYDQDKGTVKIVKTVKGETTEQLIEKGTKLENIFGYVYRQRSLGKFTEGEKNELNMPTRDVTIEYIKMTKLNTAGQKFNSHFYQSDPKKFNLFFDASEQKIPLRIDGALGFGSMTMILTSIEQKSLTELSAAKKERE